MAARSKTWIVINSGKGSRLECLRCGQFYAPTYPVPISVLGGMTTAFGKDHARCKAHPAGDVCVHCGERGHDPNDCPALTRSQTPEEWLAGPDTGISSKTIWCVMTGQKSFEPFLKGWGPGKPHDPADFGRCYRLLKLFPEWRARIGEMKQVGWGKLVDNWPELERLYEEEAPSGNAPKLFAVLKELR